MIVVYALTNSFNQKAYIGCTKYGTAKRFREHRCLLRANKHAEPDLQNDWNIHGETAFNMVVLEQLSADASLPEKREAELRWMEEMDIAGLLYNRNKRSFQPVPEASRNGVQKAVEANRTRVRSEEETERRRQAMKGRKNTWGHKISATKKRLGQKPSLETARKGGIAATAKKWQKSTDEIVSSAAE